MCGTYLTSKYVFDLKDEDTYWCTADIGWVTGHSYIIYGPLLNGASSVMYEGAPNHPDPGRFWDIVEKYSVNIFYTAPTAIRAFMKWGDDHPNGRDLSSLRLLGTVGEPINPEAWMWYHKVIGGERCPIVDTWWQTETGAIMITPLPGATPTKPGTATLPFFGIVPDVVTKDGVSVGPEGGGLLVVRKPWPSMLRTIWGDDARYKKQYWSDVKGCYFTGDGARRDKDGYVWIMGRVDDVINISGHRLGTMEVESALVANPDVAEAACVGIPHEIKGECIAAFVTMKGVNRKNDALEKRLKEWVCQGDRRHRAARLHALHRRAAQDAERQDHAPSPARHRLGGGYNRRHHDARGHLRPPESPAVPGRVAGRGSSAIELLVGGDPSSGSPLTYYASLAARRDNPPWLSVITSIHRASVPPGVPGDLAARAGA